MKAPPLYDVCRSVHGIWGFRPGLLKKTLAILAVPAPGGLSKDQADQIGVIYRPQATTRAFPAKTFPGQEGSPSFFQHFVGDERKHTDP